MDIHATTLDEELLQSRFPTFTGSTVHNRSIELVGFEIRIQRKWIPERKDIFSKPVTCFGPVKEQHSFRRLVMGWLESYGKTYQ